MKLKYGILYTVYDNEKMKMSVLPASTTDYI